MAERETKEITIPTGRKIIVKTYITVREAMPALEGTTLTEAAKSQKLAEAAIVSLDGSTENISDRLLDLPLQEYTVIMQELAAIINPTTPQK
jgi:hypothetical protein